MLSKLLQERAALYVSGAMTARQREDFELVIEFHPELREFVRSMGEVGTAIQLATLHPGDVKLPLGTKGRILERIANLPQDRVPDAFVMSGPEGLVQWINPAFSHMCGYTLDEVRGKKLGPILQGEKTDRQVAERMRRAVHDCRPCRETILNYHKNGTPYWVDIAITPIFDDDGRPLWLVAREREVAERTAA
jgi:PAS domain S-box-containing protein